MSEFCHVYVSCEQTDLNLSRSALCGKMVYVHIQDINEKLKFHEVNSIF